MFRILSVSWVASELPAKSMGEIGWHALSLELSSASENVQPHHESHRILDPGYVSNNLITMFPASVFILHQDLTAVERANLGLC